MIFNAYIKHKIYGLLINVDHELSDKGAHLKSEQKQ